MQICIYSLTYETYIYYWTITNYQLSFSTGVNFDIHNNSLAKLIEIEKNLGSERIENNFNYVSFKDEAQPIQFKRKEKVIPDLIVYYFFKLKDSTISYTLYEWDVYNFEKNDNNQKSDEFEIALIDKYNALEKIITSLYGESEVEGDLSNLSKSKVAGLRKKNTWIPNDSTEIEMYTAISNIYEKKGMITKNPTHRIRLYIRKTKKKEKALLTVDEKRIYVLDSISRSFFNTLKTKDIAKSKEFFSDMIKEQVTDQQVKKLIENINFKKHRKLSYSGLQIAPNGAPITVLQYKYVNDTSTPPKETIKILFDEEGKIVGIQPIKH